METVYNSAMAASLEEKVQGRSLTAKFSAWCKGQEENRLLWLGIGLAGHGCIITPLTFLVVAMTGLNFILLGITMFAMVAVLIVNLAALPSRITIPVFFATLLVDVAITLTALFIL